MTSPRQLSFQEKQFRIAADAALRFPPPYLEYALDEKGFYFQWQKFQLVFGLSDPAQFQPLDVELESNDKDAVLRYLGVCRELATYSLLNHKGGITFESGPGGDRITADSPPKEALRGFVVLFRQIHSEGNENANYKAVRSILGKAAANADDDQRDARLDIMKQWHRTRAALLERSLSDRGQAKIMEALGAPKELAVRSRHTPLELIALFNYGEYIHWGERRNDHAALFQDERGAAIAEFEFHDTLVGMSHFYFGYAKLLESAFGLK
ncbi:hypothetical protein [Paenarthrobacter sp. NPDC058040]|uniref:hypothetical protein n=1 Tax=unclassified Paenarthrobacter TaxID=2634190 RepID=UPI0036D98FC2